MADIDQSEIDSYPTDWSIRRVDSLFDIQQGKSVSKAHRKGDNLKPFLRTKNVFWGRIAFTELDQMHFTNTEETRLKLQAGDLLLCEGGDVGRTAIWDCQIDGCYYQNHLHRLRAKSAYEIDPQFALYWFWYAFEVANIYIGRSNVTTIPNLSQSKLSELQLPKPEVYEQRRISHVLAKVQAAIEQQARLIALTRELKSMLMRKLFTEGLCREKQKETEIGLVPESWEIRPLEDMTIAIDYGTSVKCDYALKGFPVLRIPNVVGGRIDIGDLKYGHLKKNEIDNLKLAKGDLLFVRTNGVQENAGRCSMFNDEVDDCYFASYLIRVRLDTSQLIPEYLNEYARTEVGKSFLSGRAIRTADGKFNINSGTIRKVLVPVPKTNEQGKIARQLDLLAQKTNLYIQKQSLLQELFRALLDQLMTGQIRINDIDLPGFS